MLFLTNRKEESIATNTRTTTGTTRSQTRLFSPEPSFQDQVIIPSKEENVENQDWHTSEKTQDIYQLGTRYVHDKSSIQVKRSILFFLVNYLGLWQRHHSFIYPPTQLPSQSGCHHQQASRSNPYHITLPLPEMITTSHTGKKIYARPSSL